MLLGAAWQRGLIPLSREAILQAVELNGAAVERNKQAFEMGRWAIVNPEAAERLIAAEVVEKPKTLDEKIAFRADHLTAYQGKRLAKRYRKLVDSVSDPRIKEAVAKGYHKLLSYKDEYEVARLHLETEAKAREAFDGDFKLKYHLAPPLLPGKDASGRPKKREFGPWIGRLYPVLARLKALRGTPLDVFGYSAERRMERGLIKQYQADMAEFLPRAEPADHGRTRGAGRIAALHPWLRPGQGAQRKTRCETARGPHRPSAGGRCPIGRGCRVD
jgi:indolepyruvate ferredoxin oxidoreductase